MCVRRTSLHMPVTRFHPSLARDIVPPGKKRRSLLTSYSLFWLPLLSWPDCLAQCLQKGAKLYIPSPKNKRGTAAQLLLLCRSPGRVHFQASSYSNYKVALHSQEPRKMLSLHVVKKTKKQQTCKSYFLKGSEKNSICSGCPKCCYCIWNSWSVGPLIRSQASSCAV